MINQKTLEILLDDRVQMPRMFSYDEVRELLIKYKEQLKDDILEVAGNSLDADLRREIEYYFENNKLR